MIKYVFYRSTDFNPENPSKRQKLDLLCHDAQSLSPLSLSGDREARQVRFKLHFTLIEILATTYQSSLLGTNQGISVVLLGERPGLPRVSPLVQH